MPRLLPRLLKRLSNETNDAHLQFDIRKIRGHKKKSLYTPNVERPSLHPSEYSQSILLEPRNPITHARAYTRHKTLPPRVTLPGNAKSRELESDRPRTMDENELSWWSSPYLRMLASPIRKCIVTGRYLPSDFLIRLAPMQSPGGLLRETNQITTVLVPDGLQHSRFTGRRSGRAAYILCSKETVEYLWEQQSYKRVARNMIPHPRLRDHIVHLLRLRVLQELQLLVDHLEGKSRVSRKISLPTSIIRRLTREEFRRIKLTETIPYENALAVMVVPPLNRDPVTKERPKGSMSPLPPPEEKRDLPALPPLSLLFPSTGKQLHPDENTLELPRQLIPFYNGLSLFPSQSQRATFRDLLNRLVEVNRRLVKSHNNGGDKNASHAFLLHADHHITKHADTAALAVALWRLRMFDGGGWESSSGWP